MLKIEYVWRELLYQAIEKNNPTFSISLLAKKFSLSTSVVSHALFPLKELKIVNVRKIGSEVRDVERLLTFWATRRNLKKDLIYQSFSPLSVFERETLMPPDVYPTAYSAFRLYFDDAPADYENIYFYTSDLYSVKNRFPESPKKQPNIFILQEDPFFKVYKKTTLAQIYADLWNLPEWYTKDFLEGVLLKIKEKTGL